MNLAVNVKWRFVSSVWRFNEKSWRISAILYKLRENCLSEYASFYCLKLTLKVLSILQRWSLHIRFGANVKRLPVFINLLPSVIVWNNSENISELIEGFPVLAYQLLRPEANCWTYKRRAIIKWNFGLSPEGPMLNGSSVFINLSLN